MLIVGAMRGQERLIGGYWFLHDLFFASLIAFLIMKVLKSYKMFGGFVVGLTALFYYKTINVPFWEINSRVMLGSCFFIAGKLAKIYGLIDIISRNRIQFLSFALCLCLVMVGANYNKASMFETNFQNFLPYILFAIAGTVMIHLVSNYISERMECFSTFMNYIGTHTLVILTWHFSVFKVVSVIILLVYHLDVKMLAQHPTISQFSERGWWLVYFMAGVLVPCGIVYVVEIIKLRRW